MRPFGRFYSAHCSVHMKWRVATHSDHSCCGCVSEGLRRCNLICLSCKVKAFIISARGIRCHLHWTWHMHAPLTMGDHTHTQTYTTQTVGDKVERWRFWGEDRQKALQLMVMRKPRSAGPGFALVVKVIGPVGGKGTRTHRHTHRRPVANDWGLLFSREGRAMEEMNKVINGTAHISLRLYMISPAEWPFLYTQTFSLQGLNLSLKVDTE